MRKNIIAAVLVSMIFVKSELCHAGGDDTFPDGYEFTLEEAEGNVESNGNGVVTNSKLFRCAVWPTDKKCKKNKDKK